MKFSLLDYEKLREDFNQLNVGLQAFNFSMFNQRNYLKATFLTWMIWILEEKEIW